MSPAFVHLHLHTEYSLIDGTVRINELVERARELGMPAVAITDQHNLFALVKFYQAAVRAGIKPIIGTDILLRSPDQQESISRLVLLCQNHQGFLNLCSLLSLCYLEGQHQGSPYARPDWVRQHAQGLIALSGGREGDIGQAIINQHPNRARQLLKEWMTEFPDRFYVELSRTGREGEQRYESPALALATSMKCPIVATNDVRFLQQDDFRAHEARVCIHDGRLLSDKRRTVRYAPDQYLKSPEEMAELFSDLPEALENSVELAKRCNLEMEFDRYHLPDFPTPEGENIESFLRRIAEQGVEKRLKEHPSLPEYSLDDYQSRLNHELHVINTMGFPGYFLIVADFIRWAKENDIPVGPGRGSGAGSLVAYAMGITDLDPLEHELLFERFLNPERVSMPDFDVDFCMEGRDQVIDYVAQRYGRDQVSQIITYGSMAAKAVVRDCGRVLGHGYGFVDSIAKLIPMTVGISLQEAMKEEPQLKKRYEDEDDTRGLLDLAMSLEGLKRNAGKHAGGVVIAPSKLTDFTPLYCEAGGGSVVTQFDKDDVETIGLVKFDFLGLRTLTIIHWALKTINAQRLEEGKETIKLDRLPMDDSKAFKLLQSCATTAVFQLESRGMKDLIRKLVPDSFDEIVALVALFRPGPLESGMVGDYIDRKHGRSVVQYPHPSLETILKPTYGVILYQEQVMQIAQDLAGYTLGSADILRRAMGKKKPEEMAKQRLIFVKGAVERGVEENLANSIFDQMETFAGYGFNKSHSAAYALIAYHTVWLKAHYTSAFMAAVLSSDMDTTDKVDDFIKECRSLGIDVLKPDVNSSVYAFTSTGEKTILYGLGAIKGVGKAAIDTIIAERESGGPFEDLVSFCQRMDLQRVNRRAMEVLVRSGAMHKLEGGDNRARLMKELPETLMAAEQVQKDIESGQVDMFGAPLGPQGNSDNNGISGTGTHTGLGTDPAAGDVVPWTELQSLQAERDTLGLYLSGHPVSLQFEDIRRFTTCALGKIEKLIPENAQNNRRGTPMVLAGLVQSVRRRGNRGGFVVIEDQITRLDVSLFDETWTLYAELLTKDQIIVVDGNVSVDNFSGGFRMRAQKIMTLAEAKSKFAKGVVISVRGPNDDICTTLQNAFAPYRNGSGNVYLDYTNARARARIELGEEWCIQSCEELVAALSELDSVSDARLIY